MNPARCHIHRLFDKFALYPVRELELNDLWAMQALAPLSRRYLPWSPLALRPAALVAVLNEIVINNRSQIVECGGGVSTIYVGRLLEERGEGYLHTIEDNEAWAGYLRRQLEAEGLDGRVSVIAADLVPVQMGMMNTQCRWYDPRKLEQITAGRPVDLLIVDGPPAYEAAIQHARYPAVPFFRDCFPEDYAVILDDVNRLGEQEVVHQ